MKRTLLQRVLLALIPVALLTTGSLAFSRLVTAPTLVGSPTATDAVTPAPTEEAAPPRYTRSTNDQTLIAQAQQQTSSDQTAQAEEEQHQKTMKELQQIAEEPMPELVVDKTPLTQAMTELSRAIEQIKLAQTALDGQSQSRYLQEAINLLGGFKDPAFSTAPATASGEAYKGVSPLLVEARVVREAAEVQWVAAVQQRLEARSKRLAEIAQASNSAGGTVQQPEQAQPTTDLAQTVGPTGVLGTRGVRPEEQANDIVRRAIRQAATFAREAASTGNAGDGPDSILRILDAAMKIVQIAANR
jgi:hypothetical protein